MQLIQTKLQGVYILEPRVFEDHRGWFMESYSRTALEAQGIFIDFVQDNHSMSARRGTLRGLHFQMNPKAQSKLVRCTRGAALDVCIDIRRGSPTFKEWIAVELSAWNKKQILIPKGFAHGFLTLENNVEIEYKVDNEYAPECDRSIRYDDPEIGIKWGIDEPIVSEKDLKAPLLKDSDCNFVY